MPPFRPDPLNMFTKLYADMRMNDGLGLGESGVRQEEVQTASSIGQSADQLLHPGVGPCEARLASIDSGSSTSDGKTFNGEHMWWNAGNKGDVAERFDIIDDSSTFSEIVEQHSTYHSGDIFDASDPFPVDVSFGLSIRTSCSGIGPELNPDFIQYPETDKAFGSSDSPMTPHHLENKSASNNGKTRPQPISLASGTLQIAHLQADLPSSTLASSTPVADFYCGINGCKRSYRRYYELKRHQKGHSSTRGYGCRFPQCNRSGQNGFVRKDHLKQHLRQVHGVA